MKRILFDTHCWLWLQSEPERFSPALLHELSDPTLELLLSAASAWEIAIKFRLGKLALPEPPASYVPSRLQRSGTAELVVSHLHALRVASLPLHHRDPFDRLLVAQAQIEDIPLLSADPLLRPYEVELRSPFG
jgi:PIN domain nuclease of toxin-antitoxin system